LIAIIDFGHGNVASIANMLKRIGAPEVLVTADRDAIRRADKLILPGVGAFESGMQSLKQQNLIETLEQRVFEDRVPILGICLGMQLMSRSSREGANAVRGLGWIDGETVRLAPGEGRRVPHMGWTFVKFPLRQHSDGADSRFYFAHSYHVRVDNPDQVLATADYGGEIIAGVRAGNIFGVQFHPEKSHHYGKALLQTFAETGCL
jgi:glutamine amidotransferase